MKTYYDCIIEPLKTEKGSLDEKNGKYCFKVLPASNKREIRSAVEKVFNVHVLRVNTMMSKGKLKKVRYQPGYAANWKKAIVTLKKGEKLDLT